MVEIVCFCPSWISKLLGRGRDAPDLGGPGGQLFHHLAPGAAQEHGLQLLAQVGEVLVAQDLAALVGDPVAVEETEGRTQPPVVEELHDREEIVEAILQGRPREHQREARPEALDDPARLGFPVLDALPLVEHDQVPASGLHGREVPEHLLVVDDREEGVCLVLGHPLGGASQHELAGALREPLHLGRPLGLERSGANDEDPRDAGLARQELRRADALDRLPQAHVVGQDGPAGPGGEGDAVELVGQERRLEELLAQGVTGRVPANLGGHGRARRPDTPRRRGRRSRRGPGLRAVGAGRGGLSDR
jgi:hypothetical protein